jgi:hypothetical protein
VALSEGKSIFISLLEDPGAKIIGIIERGEALGSKKAGPMFLAIYGLSSFTPGFFLCV